MDATIAFVLFLIIWLFGQPGFINDLMIAFGFAAAIIALGFFGFSVMTIKR